MITLSHVPRGESGESEGSSKTNSEFPTTEKLIWVLA